MSSEYLKFDNEDTKIVKILNKELQKMKNQENIATAQHTAPAEEKN